jgi:hypothetical protein
MDDRDYLLWMGAFSISRKATKQALLHAGKIETKGGVLLSHISIMIAVAGVLFSTLDDDDAVLRIVLGAELVAYLILAVCSLWLQSEVSAKKLVEIQKASSAHNPDKLSRLERQFFDTLLLKQRVLQLVQWALYVLTIILGVVVICTLHGSV